MRKDYLSTETEPALHADHQLKTDPAEDHVGAVATGDGDLEHIRDSVFNEPAYGEDGTDDFLKWLREKQAVRSMFTTVLLTLGAGVCGGLFALVGAIVNGRQGMLAVIAIILFGPVVEELLKQSGMVYLLERKPYRLVGVWQFVLVAILSSLIFATVENLIYIHVYGRGGRVSNPEIFSMFRWSVCTTLHLCCSLIASMGLIRVWKETIQKGKPAELSYAYPLFAVAIGVHGFYNFLAVFVIQRLVIF